MLLVSVHYGFSIKAPVNVGFVIIQEFVKVCVFQYVVYFYLSHAIEYTVEVNEDKFLRYVRLGSVVFLTLVGGTMFVWAILRL